MHDLLYQNSVTFSSWKKPYTGVVYVSPEVFVPCIVILLFFKCLRKIRRYSLVIYYYHVVIYPQLLTE